MSYRFISSCCWVHRKSEFKNDNELWIAQSVKSESTKSRCDFRANLYINHISLGLKTKIMFNWFQSHSLLWILIFLYEGMYRTNIFSDFLLTQIKLGFFLLYFTEILGKMSFCQEIFIFILKLYHFRQLTIITGKKQHLSNQIGKVHTK